jgi:hypothetical protein
VKFLDQGKYEFRDGTLFVEAEHDGDPCLLAIDREVLEVRYGVTAKGRFQEYWTSVLQNRQDVEDAARRKAGDDASSTIHLALGDL